MFHTTYNWEVGRESVNNFDAFVGFTAVLCVGSFPGNQCGCTLKQHGTRKGIRTRGTRKGIRRRGTRKGIRRRGVRKGIRTRGTRKGIRNDDHVIPFTGGVGSLCVGPSARSTNCVVTSLTWTLHSLPLQVHSLKQ